MIRKGGGIPTGGRLALSVIGAVTLTVVGAFGAAPRVIARTTPVIGSRTDTTSPATLASAATAGGAPHIMVIVEENEGYTDILGSSSPATVSQQSGEYLRIGRQLVRGAAQQPP